MLQRMKANIKFDFVSLCEDIECLLFNYSTLRMDQSGFSTNEPHASSEVATKRRVFLPLYHAMIEQHRQYLFPIFFCEPPNLCL